MNNYTLDHAPIKRWSFSRLAEFETCKYRTYLKNVLKVPEPERPLPPGKTEHANDRGSRIHEQAEAFVRGKGPLPTEAESYRAEFESLATRFAKGQVSLEGEWGFSHDWHITDYNGDDVWARIKLDAMVRLTPTHGAVIDYKTGRKFGNEIKHGEQTQLYAVAAMLRDPTLETITTELWYLDQNELTRDVKPVTMWRHHLKPFHNRGMKMTTCTSFPPNPNTFSCRWCPYKADICQFAHKG